MTNTMRIVSFILILWLGGVAFVSTALADSICVVDDRERKVCLDRPAQRIAALSPGATEWI